MTGSSSQQINRTPVVSFRNKLAIVAVVAGLMTVVASPFAWRGWRSVQLNQLANDCRVAATHGRWHELKQLAGNWSTIDPASGEARMLCGQAAIGLEEWSNASDYFWSVPDTDSSAVRAMVEVSKLAFHRLDNPLRGAEACERILRINPRAAGATQQLIGFYATTLQREKLLQQIRSAITAQAEPREAYVHFFLLYTLKSRDAVILNQRWLKSDPSNEMFLVARALQLPESTTESQETPALGPASEPSQTLPETAKPGLIDELLRRFPHNTELLAHQADEYLADGNLDGATSLLSQAPDSAGNDARFWRLKGWIHESNAEFDQANSAYRRALQLHPVDWITMNRLAVVERHRQNIPEVTRLTKLVERANDLRRVLRKLTSVENVAPPILIELAKFCRDCGETMVGPALERRMGVEQTNH